MPESAAVMPEGGRGRKREKREKREEREEREEKESSTEHALLGWI